MKARIILFALGTAAIAAVAAIGQMATAEPSFQPDEAAFVAAVSAHTGSLTYDEIVSGGYEVCDLIEAEGLDGAYDYYANNSQADLLISSVTEYLCEG